MAMRLSEIAACVDGVLLGEDKTIRSVSIDTRTIKPEQLYIAIKGQQFDGNDFVGDAERAGAVAALVNHGVSANIPLIQVADTRLALAQLAARWRQTAPIRMVGITGSNGKTTVKEMTAAILAAAAGDTDKVLFTQGNLNNDIGVPLTLLRLQDAHKFAVIEMGANHPGEIAYTSKIAQADVAILNNAGPAHLEGFGSVEGVAKAKGEIITSLADNGIAILNRDDPFFAFWLELAKPRRVLSFGVNSLADVSAKNLAMSIRDEQFITTFDLVTQAGVVNCCLQLAGRHNVLNALAAIAAALALDIDINAIVQGLASVKPVTGRLQLLRGRLGSVVIDDTYNANAASLKVGLDVLALCNKESWLALGAFGELGEGSEQIHFELGQMIKASGVTKLYATGSNAKHTVTAFGEGAQYFEQQEQLITALSQDVRGHEAILVKGSRSQRMENVAAALVENFRK